MSEYGIVDIGSNTVVLVIYDSIQPIHVKSYYSEPVRLVGYNRDGIMEQEGITKTLQVLKQYKRILEEEGITEYYAFITEPWRHLKNTDELLDGLAESGFLIDPLSGRQEAEYDFYGSRMDCADIETGIAFDVGGGSSELISFENGQIHEAVSIPIGAVRLKTLPLSPAVPAQYMNNAFLQAPRLLDTPSDLIVGIGGTARAIGLLAQELYPNQPVTRAMIGQMLEDLIHEEPVTVAAMKKVILPGRWAILAPGMNMVCGVMDAFHATNVRISEGCVREGYLLTHVHPQ